MPLHVYKLNIVCSIQIVINKVFERKKMKRKSPNVFSCDRRCACVLDAEIMCNSISNCVANYEQES